MLLFHSVVDFNIQGGCTALISPFQVLMCKVTNSLLGLGKLISGQKACQVCWKTVAHSLEPI